MDNCAGQNKNWALFSLMVCLVNDNEIAAKEIVFNYLEPGHTYMSADSFHHQVAKSIRMKGKVYDFDDFVETVQSSNSRRVKVISLEYSDFFLEFDYSSTYKISKKTNPRPYMANMVQVSFRRGSLNMSYRISFGGEEIELDFLKTTYIKRKNIPSPRRRTSARGICKTKKDDIINRLVPLMPENRKLFWRNVQEDDVPDLSTDYDD